LGDASNVRASRTKTGPFENLRSYPEFRDMVVSPAPLAVPKAANSATPPRDAPAAPAPRRAPAPPVAPQPAPAAPPEGGGDGMPHIDLQGSGVKGSGEEPSGGEWMKWGLLVLIAVATAVIAFLFMEKR